LIEGTSRQTRGRESCTTWDGLHFRREGNHWRCIEQPDLMMLHGDRYRVG
jgi:hypothetical protein